MPKKVRLVLVFLSPLFPLGLAAQNISGVVNIYTPVTAIGCNSVNVISANGFSPNDRVLLIQMKGAVIDSSNSSAYGTITGYGNCGNYEFATVASIAGNTVNFVNSVLNNYTVSGHVQLVRIAVYNNATINGQLSCSPWNGATGGVLVLELSGTLTFNSNIYVSGYGFRGGLQCTNPDGSCGAGYPDYFYPVASGFGAEKGEGITEVSVNMNGGRGALGNGGGGGNKHNSGGGGGGNFSAGGRGGDEANFCPVTPVGGSGGVSLNYSLGKIFLGGGGGCSDNNNAVGTPGENGGGIVIIRASSISGNGYSIFSDGIDVGVVPNGIGDGAGGGGAGGTILLDVPNYTGVLNCLVRGGKGGDQNTTYPACFGPGGGGGTGVVYFSLPSAPGNVITTTVPGAAGMDVNSSSSCYMTSYGAASGQAANGVLNNLVIPESNSPGLSISFQTTPGVCGNNASATANPTGGISPYMYSWSNGQTSQTASGLAAGTYTVTVTGANGCSQTQSVTVTSTNAISVAVSSMPSNCSGNTGSATATPASGTAPYTYNWSNSQTTSTATGLAPGNYTVTVTDANGCSQTQSVTVGSAGGPVAAATASSSTIAPGGTTSLTATGGATYSWFPSTGLSCTTCANPVAAPAQTTSYCVVVTDTNGCTDIACITITVEIPCVLSSLQTLLPNAFSPNNDANNDQYCVPANACVLSFVLKVYDRWGEKVFESDNLSNCWDGTFKGKALNTDIFVYYFEAQLSNGEHFSQKGNISLVH